MGPFYWWKRLAINAMRWAKLTHKHSLCAKPYRLVSFSWNLTSATELGAIWARVLIVSSGWPTRTWAAPPTLPASNSLIVDKEPMARLIVEKKVTRWTDHQPARTSQVWIGCSQWARDSTSFTRRDQFGPWWPLHPSHTSSSTYASHWHFTSSDTRKVS